MCEYTTGCKPARALPTQSPAKPDSVMGESITLFSPNLSRSPSLSQYRGAAGGAEIVLIIVCRGRMGANAAGEAIIGGSEVRTNLS